MDKKVDVVLIEDNQSDAELTIRAFRKNHLLNNLIHLRDGAEALDFLLAKGKFSDRNKNNMPKVILLDLKMPKVNGLEVLKVIKKDEATRTIPVVLLTSSKEDSDIEEGYKLGVNSYIVKPVEFDNFTKAVSEIGLYWLLLNHPPK